MNVCVEWGLSKTPSYIAFRLADQVAHVTASFTKSACDSEFINEKSHCLALGSVVAISWSTITSSPKAHMHLDIVYWSNECRQESSARHIPQALDVAMWWCACTSFVGSECLARRHRNILIFLDTWIFQSFFDGSWFNISVRSSSCPLQPCLSPLLYRSQHFVCRSNREDVVSFEIPCHVSSIFLVQRGMLTIDGTSMGKNTSCMRWKFLVVAVASMISDTVTGGLLAKHP